MILNLLEGVWSQFLHLEEFFKFVIHVNFLRLSSLLVLLCFTQLIFWGSLQIQDYFQRWKTVTQNSKRNTVAQVTPDDEKFTACNVQ